jgi:hypothetical protein
MVPYPITAADLLDLLYPHGRLRTSRAYQGTGPRTNWNAFALAEERCQIITEASSAHRVSSETVAQALAENA